MTDYFICGVDESVSVALGAFGPGKALHGGCHQEEPSLGLGCNQGGNDSPGKRQGLWPSFACREGSLAAVSSSYIPVLTSLRVASHLKGSASLQGICHGLCGWSTSVLGVIWLKLRRSWTLHVVSGHGTMG